MTDPSKLKLSLRYWLHGKEYFTALKAMDLAASYHKGMRKDGKTPEFHHQVSIAAYIRTLPNLLKREETIAAAFLHDLVEDYSFSLIELENRFGPVITKSVKLLTKDTEGYYDIYFDGIGSNDIASIVKGADRMHNFQSMVGVFTKEKQLDYINECEQLIMPMLKDARRLFPEQETAYENIKLVLCSQMDLLKAINGVV